MHGKDADVDLSIELSPVDAPRVKQKPRRSIFSYLLIGGAILLSLSVVAAFLFRLSQLVKASDVNVVVAAQRDSAAERDEAVAVFSGFDAIEEARRERPLAEQQERDEILKLLQQLEQCVGEEDAVAFREHVDFDRLLKRIELTGGLIGWTNLDKRFLRTDLKESVDPDSFWNKLIVAGIITPPENPDTRIVYAFGWDQSKYDQASHRLWIARNGPTWRLYDWERLDLGLSESQELGLYCKYHTDPAMEGFRRWAKLMREADSLTTSGDWNDAREKVRLSESEPIPPEFEDYRWMLTGYRWASLNESAEAKRCYLRVMQPADMPGAFMGLVYADRAAYPTEALKYAEWYQAATGPGPALLEAKAMLLEDLNRDQEAVAAWKELLRIQPDNLQALSRLYFALPMDDKSDFEAQLARLENPGATIAGLVGAVGYRDFNGLLMMVDFLERTAPDSPNTLYVTGFSRFLDGRHAEAAELYRRAFESESDEDKRLIYVQAYVEAMVEDGKVIEALKTTPDPKSAIESLVYGYDDQEVSLTDEEYRQLIDLYVERFPDSLDAIQRKADLAVKEDQFEVAERILNEALVKLPMNGEADSEEVTDPRDSGGARESLTGDLGLVLARQGRVKEAFDKVKDSEGQFSRLATELVDDQRWEDARLLADMQRERDPDDPELHALDAKLAVHDKRWDEAISHFQQALELDPEHTDSWSWKYDLVDAYIESGQWMKFYESHEDRDEAFDELARRLSVKENWEALESLAAAHRTHSHDDPKIAKHLSEAAWVRDDFVSFAQYIEEPLENDDGTAMYAYERDIAERRLLSALLRSGQIDRAIVLANQKQQEARDVEMLAMVRAARGELDEAFRLAREAAAEDDDASEFYLSNAVSHIFLSDRFHELHREFPIGLSYGSSQLTAVLLLEAPHPLEPGEISTALAQLGVVTPATPEPLEVVGGGATRAFALRFDKASVWMASGEGKFDEGWKLDERSGSLAGAVNNSRAWVAIGIAAWTEFDRKQVEPLARRMAVQLANRGVAACVLVEDGSEDYACPVSPELLQAWQLKGNLGPYREQCRQLETANLFDDVSANRGFNRSMREAVGEFESSPFADLEVWACLANEVSIDPIKVDVTSVRRAYGGLNFVGSIENQSLLFPQLRPGMTVKVYPYQVRAWRLNDNAPVFRPTRSDLP